IPSCVKRYSLGLLRSRGVRPCSPLRFKTEQSICGDSSTRSRRGKQPNSLPKARRAFAPSLTTSSFNALAMAGPDEMIEQQDVFDANFRHYTLIQIRIPGLDPSQIRPDFQRAARLAKRP